MIDERLFELRIYTATAGNMDALINRFREPTVRLFTKHGLTVEAFWRVTSTEDGELEKLVYLLSFPNLAEATERWRAFRADPEWIKARADTETNGLLVAGAESHYMSATDFSPFK